jgi:hypothetical protein
MPWSAWQNPSASCARMPPTAAPLGWYTMTGRATGSNARIRVAAAQTRRAASLAPWSCYWTTLPVSMAGRCLPLPWPAAISM